MTETTALARLDKASQALAKAETLEEISVIRSHAKVFQIHAKEFKLGREAILAAVTIQLLAELKAGDVAQRVADDKEQKSEYGSMLEASRLESGQVNRWRREANRIRQTCTLSGGDFDTYLRQSIDKYVQSIRENPDADMPSFRGYLFFMTPDGIHEENEKEARTELTKLFCSFYPFNQASGVVKNWLDDKGRSKEERDAISTMWAQIGTKGNIFKGQKVEIGE